MQASENKPIEMLLVEDNPGDIMLTIEALEASASKITKKIHTVRDGEEALKFLKKQEPFADVNKPDVILLDLNLPRINGKQVLEEIKKDDNIKQIPVIIFTSSEADIDITETYALHANCYIVKPYDSTDFTSTVQGLNDFWLSLARLPN